MAKILKAEYSFTRPNNTTAYAANDLVANSTTAGSVEPMALSVGKGRFRIATMVLSKSGTGVANASFNAYFWLGPKPTTTAGDNAAWSLANTPKDGYFVSRPSAQMGGTMSAHTDGACVYHDDNNFDNMVAVSETGYLWVYLTAAAAYTPVANEVFTLTLYYQKD